jgi:hypothetical protein
VEHTRRIDPMEVVAAVASNGVPLSRRTWVDRVGGVPCAACLAGQIALMYEPNIINADLSIEEVLNVSTDYLSGYSDAFERVDWNDDDTDDYRDGFNDALEAIAALKEHDLWPKELG